jgi:hypothetical protein
VQFGGLSTLHLVPDEETVWIAAQQALRGQIVPACRAHCTRNFQSARSTQPVALIGTELNCRRDENDVWPISAKEASYLTGGWNHVLQGSGQAYERL